MLPPLCQKLIDEDLIYGVTNANYAKDRMP